MAIKTLTLTTEKNETEMYLTMHQAKKINEICENLDLEEIHNYMESVNWTWFFKEDIYKVPTVQDIKDEILRLAIETYAALQEMPETEETSISTGGLKVTAYRDGDELEVEFVLTSWWTGK